MSYNPRPSVTGTPSTDDKLIMGGYVSNDGDAAGMLVPKYLRQYDLEALSGTKMGADCNVYCSTVAFAEEQKVSAFSDVPADHWDYSAITNMTEKGKS